MFGSSGAGIRTSSGLLPSSVLFQRTLYVLTLGEGEATQATSPESSSTRKFVGARGRVVKLPVRGVDEVSVSLPKGVARCSTWSVLTFFGLSLITHLHPVLLPSANNVWQFREVEGGFLPGDKVFRRVRERRRLYRKSVPGFILVRVGFSFLEVDKGVNVTKFKLLSTRIPLHLHL